MKLLDKPTHITSTTRFDFRVDRPGWFLISISARVKSEKQRGKGITDDEDLRVEIDGSKFPKLDNPHRYADAPAAFSGGKLHNQSKTVYFIVHLEVGLHTVELIPDEGALVEGVEISRVSDFPNFEFQLERRAQKANTQPWLTFVLVNLGLKAFTVQATTKWRFPDGDDLKLVVDDRIKKNNWSLLHRNWIFTSSIFSKLFGRETIKQTFNENLLPADLHYLEIWADQSPTLHSIELDLLPPQAEDETPDLTKARVVWPQAKLKEQPQQSSQTLATLTQGSSIAILGKAIQGERPLNENGVPQPSDRWHKVRHQDQEGYIFSQAVEVQGEDNESIKRLITQKANALGAGPKIATALSQCESGLLPYAVSEADAMGLFQLTPILISDLNDSNKPFYSPVSNPFDLQQNISGGLSYFKWLLELYRGDTQQLEKAIVAYNAGPGNVPAGHLDLSQYEFQTRRLVSCVKKHARKD